MNAGQECVHAWADLSQGFDHVGGYVVVLDEVCERNVGFQCQDLEADHAAMCVKVDVDVSGLERGSNTPDCANLTCILFASPVARRVTLPALVVFTDMGPIRDPRAKCPAVAYMTLKNL